MQDNQTKLLVGLLTGGKAAGSAVKFANFYLIIDGHTNPDVSIPNCFKVFQQHLKSRFTTGKGGDSAFKVLADGSYMNAYTSIADTLKFIEEAIQVCNSNGVGAAARPGTNPGSTGRAGTANSGKSGKSKVEAAAAAIE